MGLLDILNGMQNGPRGGQQQAPSGGGGMPTWMMALLGLLAYKAIKGGGLGNMMGGGNANRAPQMNPQDGGGGLGDILGNVLGGGGRGGPMGGGGGLGDILGGALGGGGRGAPSGGGFGNILGGLLGGAAAGGMLNGGLRHLVQDMENNGQGDAARSWVGAGDNQHMSPDDLGRAVGLDDIDAVAHQTGMPREQLLSELSQHLPEFVNQLTPDGRMPTDDEAQSRWV